MSLLNFLTKRRGASASQAAGRLQVLLAHERALADRTDLVRVLEQEILAVIARHIPLDRDKVAVKLERGAHVSTLEIDIEVPAAVAGG